MYKREWNRTAIKHARKRHVVQTKKVSIGTRPASCVCVWGEGGGEHKRINTRGCTYYTRRSAEAYGRSRP